MPPPFLRVLVVDAHKDSVQSLVELVASRGHRADLLTNGHEALSAVMQKRRNDEPFDLVIANVGLPTLDGISLLRELRSRQDDVHVALYGEMPLSSETISSAQRLGCALITQGIDVKKIDALLSTCLREKKAAGGGNRDQPFFGTSRITRAVSAGGAYQTPGEDSSEKGHESTPLGEHELEQPLPMPERQGAGTGSGSRAGQQPGYGSRSAGEIGTSTRIRRGVTGRLQNPIVTLNTPTQQPPERRVLCATCHKEFVVAPRKEEFTVVCVHCGQLNRIVPK